MSEKTNGKSARDALASEFPTRGRWRRSNRWLKSLKKRSLSVSIRFGFMIT